ncbi:hypothetical protein H8356DRAFT_1688238 [Neocallimastix lanati (nom. inval.)]|uniref:Uncharacterized protein n=1 Tax=Neocallimastix californiae TaxID=1754190 RepID=A0A1Y2AJB2_9FUNG|nr:hypothetical protein H8356DRAFT_1688238 [Neocallimastix sp. JGI-2020a]ORY22663.1 hypothetical protein LY90DRAFT_675809 [Neocallimastix californiae]|eukprot:ORY22663.1 hypothetical protein LY90DRAFT_675809 [Neocallimastix californiae]
MEKSYKYSLKHILLIVLIFSLLLVQVSSEPKEKVEPKPEKKIEGQKSNILNNKNSKAVTNKPKALTPKKYRKNFVIRIPKTVFNSDGPKRITITRTTPPVTIGYEIPTHTGDETTTYYSTFGYDFISPSPQPSRIFRKRNPKNTLKPNKNENPIPITKAP